VSAPRIYVLAGVNGAGKSSIGGAVFRAANADYFNPDEAARKICAAHPGTPIVECNSQAWSIGKRLLKRAVENRLDFAFETTLGGDTITALLIRAAREGIELHVWYAGLDSVERHIARVRSRVVRGGHDIPESDVRRRWDRSRENLLRLLPHLTGLRVFDNSTEGDPANGCRPSLQLVLALKRGVIVAPKNLARTPAWAKPIVASAMKRI
jgi:predicted ABC-type ATPase